MKVTIENKGSSSLSIKGRHSFFIGAHTTVTVELPDTPNSANMIQRLRREYPAMRVIIEKADPLPRGAAKAGNPPTPTDDSNPTQAASTGSSRSSEGAEAGGTKMSAENFTARAKATAGEAGWWTVAVEGLQDIKVRSAKNESNAIEMAYAKYLEGQGGE